MKWKDTEGQTPPQPEASEDYYDEEQYSPWKRTSLRDMLSRFLGGSAVPILGAIIGIVALVILILIFLPGGRGTTAGPDISVLDARIRQLEERQAQSEAMAEKTTTTDSRDAAIEQLQGRIDRLEASLGLRMDQLAAAVEKMNRKPPEPVAAAPKPPVAAAPKQPVAAPDKPAAPVQEAVKKAPAKPTPSPRIHTVQAGETLYAISRKYGITVEELRRFNRIGPEEPIRPNQELVVGPGAKP